MSANRDYSDPYYKGFRQRVRNRDKCCKWPNCKKKKKLQVHHILPWQQFPLLRYEDRNGILLCKEHHKMVTGKELIYAKFLKDLI